MSEEIKTVDASAQTAARLLDILCRVPVAEGLPTEGTTHTVIEFEELDYADLSTIGRLAAALGTA